MSQDLRERVERLQNENNNLKQEKMERERMHEIKLGEMNKEINILNLKLQELDKLTREREEFRAKMNLLHSDNERLNNIINQLHETHRGASKQAEYQTSRKQFKDNIQTISGNDFYLTDPYTRDQRSLIDQSGRSHRQNEDYYVGEDEFEGLATGKNGTIEKDSEFMRTSYDIQRPTEDFEDIDRKKSMDNKYLK